MRRMLLLPALALALPGCAPAMKAQANMVHDLKIRDALAAYQAAATPVDRCVKSKLVAIAYEDARDAPNGAAWRAREHEDCDGAIAAMGVQRPAEKPGT